MLRIRTFLSLSLLVLMAVGPFTAFANEEEMDSDTPPGFPAAGESFSFNFHSAQDEGTDADGNPIPGLIAGLTIPDSLISMSISFIPGHFDTSSDEEDEGMDKDDNPNLPDDAFMFINPFSSFYEKEKDEAGNPNPGLPGPSFFSASIIPLFMEKIVMGGQFIMAGPIWVKDQALSLYAQALDFGHKVWGFWGHPKED